MNERISVKTTRYSELFKRILKEYNKNVKIYIDGRQYFDKDISKLINEWCTNHTISNTKDFMLRKDGLEIFRFHDTPKDFWAAISEKPFLERLSQEKIIRYRITPLRKKSFLFKFLYNLIMFPIKLFFASIRFLMKLFS